MNSTTNNSTKTNQLRFVVTNDPDFDFELMQEVWLNNNLLADLRYIDEEWVVTFFAQEQAPQLTLADFANIDRTFQQFVQEQTQSVDIQHETY